MNIVRCNDERTRGDASSVAASACCPGCGDSGSRCRGRASRTATRGRSRPGPGVVLVDTGMHQPGSIAQLERAMEQVNLRLEHVQLVVATHAHSDHWGQAAPIRDRAGCEFWMHPNHEHATRSYERPRGRARPPARGRSPERRVRAGAAARTPSARRTFPSGVARGDRARPAARARGRDRDRPRHVARVRDARPCALARVPVPARAAAADLRRPPARPDLAVLRLRLDARPGRRVPELARRRRRARRAPVPVRATAARSSTSHGHVEGNRKLVHERIDARARGGSRAASRRRSSRSSHSSTASR